MKKLLIIALSALAVSCSGGRPVIGISSGSTDGRISIREEYSNAIARAGGIPLVIPMTTDSSLVEACLDAIDGLVMSGGDDIQPEYYGERKLNETVVCDPRCDTSDFMLLGAACRRGMPVLAICRGAQVANVMFGGTLYQDIPSQVGSEISHHQGTIKRSTPTHIVYIEQGSRLHDLLDIDSVAVNSFHHQAVKKIGHGFTVTALSADGITEGFEGNGLFCVQFHPESSVSAGYDTFLPIFAEFVEDADRFSARRGH